MGVRPEPMLIGEWEVYPALDELRRRGETVKLEPRTMRLLCVLAEQPGEVLSGDALLEAVWPGVVVGPASIYQAVAALRRALGDSGDDPRYVATVPRKGYRLVATVRRLPPAVAPVDDRHEHAAAPGAGAMDATAPAIAAPAVAAAAESSTAAAAQPSIPAPASAARSTSRPRAHLALAAAAAVLVVVALAAWLLREAPPAVGVALVPIADLTEDGTARDFARGLTDELAAALGRAPHVEVRTEAGADAALVRRRLAGSGVRYLFEGSVRAQEGRLRFTARLVDVRDGFQVWANSYDRAQGAAVATQAELAAAVVAALRDHLTATPANSGDEPVAVSAYDLYLLGRRQQLLRHHEAIDRAIVYYRRALEVDPRFALAHAGLADAQLGALYYQGRSLAEVAPIVEREVAAALELDFGLAEAYAARGLLRVEQWRLDEAVADLEHALAINPGLGEAHLRLGMAREYAARPRDALAAYDQLLALDPLHMQVHLRRCLVLTMLGRTSEAQPACERAVDLQPELPNPQRGRGLLALARGAHADAIAAYEAALGRAPHRSDLRRELVMLQLDVGMRASAAALVDAGRELASADDADHQLAAIYVQLHAGELAAVRAALGSATWPAAADASGRIAAARAAFLAGDRELARRLAQAPPGERMPGNTYALLWGECERCTLASVGGAVAGASTGEPRDPAPDAWLRTLADAGYRGAGFEYADALRSAERGDPRAALAALERAYGLGWRRAWTLRLEPAFASLRREPRFRALLDRIERDGALVRAALANARTVR